MKTPKPIGTLGTFEDVAGGRWRVAQDGAHPAPDDVRHLVALQAGHACHRLLLLRP